MIASRTEDKSKANFNMDSVLGKGAKRNRRRQFPVELFADKHRLYSSTEFVDTEWSGAQGLGHHFSSKIFLYVFTEYNTLTTIFHLSRLM